MHDCYMNCAGTLFIVTLMMLQLAYYSSFNFLITQWQEVLRKCWRSHWDAALSTLLTFSLIEMLHHPVLYDIALKP